MGLCLNCRYGACCCRPRWRYCSCCGQPYLENRGHWCRPAVPLDPLWPPPFKPTITCREPSLGEFIGAL